MSESYFHLSNAQIIHKYTKKKYTNIQTRNTQIHKRLNTSESYSHRSVTLAKRRPSVQSHTLVTSRFPWAEPQHRPSHSVELSAFVCLCICVFVHLCICVFVHLCICPFEYLFICVFVYLCIRVFVHLCICAFVHLCICAFLYLCICVLVHLCICAFVYLCI